MKKLVFPFLIITVSFLCSCDFLSNDSDNSSSKKTSLKNTWKSSESYYSGEKLTIKYDEGEDYFIYYFDGKKMTEYSVAIETSAENVSYCSDNNKNYEAKSGSIEFSYKSSYTDEKITYSAKYKIENNRLTLTYEDGSYDILDKTDKSITDNAKESCEDRVL